MLSITQAAPGRNTRNLCKYQIHGIDDGYFSFCTGGGFNYRDGLKGGPVLLSYSKARRGKNFSQPKAHLKVHLCTSGRRNIRKRALSTLAQCTAHTRASCLPKSSTKSSFPGPWAQAGNQAARLAGCEVSTFISDGVGTAGCDVREIGQINLS